jgi:hypothetical protein
MESKNPHSAKAKLATVRPDSPAGQAGLAKGDRIVALDGKPIRNQTDLRFALGPRYAGDKVRVAVERGKERLEREITLAGELPPFRHAFLGILPMRTSIAAAPDKEVDDAAAKADADDENVDDTADDESSSPAGVTVRMVYAGSRAEEGGIRAGDRLTQIQDSDVTSIDEALSALNNAAPGTEVSLKLLRGDESIDVSIKADRMPANVPAEIPSAYESTNDNPETDGKAAKEEKGDAKRTAGETRDLKLPEFPQTCKVYVPAATDADRPLGVLIWLPPPGETKPDDIIDQWKAICDRDGVLLVVPSPAEATRWDRTELDYLRRLTERIAAEYNVDRRRLCVFGQSGGGSMAWLLGLSSRDLFRGIATSAAPLPRQVSPPANEPSQRVAIFAAIPAAKDVAAQVGQSLEQFSEAGFPVTTVTTSDDTGKLTESQREELARWIDTLDKF